MFSESDDSVRLQGTRVKGDSDPVFNNLSSNQRLHISPRDQIGLIVSCTADTVSDLSPAKDDNNRSIFIVVITLVTTVCISAVVVVTVLWFHKKRHHSRPHQSVEKRSDDVHGNMSAQNESDVILDENTPKIESGSGSCDAGEEDLMVENDLYQGAS